MRRTKWFEFFMSADKGIEFLPHTSSFLIHISFEPDGVNLWYFKPRLSDLTEFTVQNN